jgi:hypothetical protein
MIINANDDHVVHVHNQPLICCLDDLEVIA